MFRVLSSVLRRTAVVTQLLIEQFCVELEFTGNELGHVYRCMMGLYHH